MIGHPLLSFTSGSTVTPVVAQSQPQAGGFRKTGKRRWWRIGDRLYKASLAEMESVMDAMVAAEEPPPVQSKPAPRSKKPVQLQQVKVPELPVFEWDWRPVYVNAALQRDAELLAVLEASIRRRMEEDEEDAVMALLLH